MKSSAYISRATAPKSCVARSRSAKAAAVARASASSSLVTLPAGAGPAAAHVINNASTDATASPFFNPPYFNITLTRQTRPLPVELHSKFY